MLEVALVVGELLEQHTARLTPWARHEDRDTGWTPVWKQQQNNNNNNSPKTCLLQRLCGTHIVCDEMWSDGGIHADASRADASTWRAV